MAHVVSLSIPFLVFFLLSCPLKSILHTSVWMVLEQCTSDHVTPLRNPSHRCPCTWNKICTCYCGPQGSAWPGPCLLSDLISAIHFVLGPLVALLSLDHLSYFTPEGFLPLLEFALLLLLFVQLALLTLCILVEMPPIQRAFFDLCLAQLPPPWLPITSAYSFSS